MTNVRHSPRIKTYLAHNPFALPKEPMIPIEHERYFSLFKAIFNSAKKDILRAQVGSPRFESAAEWFTDGWYYTILEHFTDRVYEVKEFWQGVINKRRDETGSQS